MVTLYLNRHLSLLFWSAFNIRKLAILTTDCVRIIRRHCKVKQVSQRFQLQLFVHEFLA